MATKQKNLLKIQASLFQNDGASTLLSNEFVEQWQARNPDTQVVSRDLAAEPAPHLDLARFQSFLTAEEERSDEQKAVAAYSEGLIEEVRNADVLVLGIPMYNFSVPSTLHTYFDHIARAGITFRYTANGPEGLLKGKKAVVFIARGGVYGEDHAQTAYVRQFLGFIGITDVEFVHAEGLAANGEEGKAESLAAAREKITQLL